ncbi:MAG: alpha/beta fold hydrolase [Actinomycetales bacterium]
MTLPPPWPGQTRVVGRHELHVRRAQDGAAAAVAVAVHGLAGSAANWTDLAAALLPDVTTVMPDLPGHGFSPMPADGDLSLGAHVDAVVSLCRELAAASSRPVHLLGNSLGGVVAALAAAAEGPNGAVASLTLVSAALPQYRLRRTNAHLPLLALPRVGEVLGRRVAALPVERRVATSMGLIYAEPDLVPEQRRQEALAEAARRDELDYAGAALLGSLRGLMSSYFSPSAARRVWGALARVEVPSLVVQGLHDRLVHPTTARRLYDRLPQAVAQVELPGAGHVAQMEQPHLVAAAFRQFLLGISDATGRLAGS